MIPVRDISEVFAAIQKAKAGALEFNTNFFPIRHQLEDWINQDDLLIESSDETVLFLRKDENFWHLYFSTKSLEELQRAIYASPMLKAERIVTDLIGTELALKRLLSVFEAVEFHHYNRLYRMARLALDDPAEIKPNETRVDFAEKSDSGEILDLIIGSLDRYAEQFPNRNEIETAAHNRQILTIKCAGTLAGLLFFETRGLTSIIRYWLVGEPFRAQQLGSALMQYYFVIHSNVRRFVLWVIANNENAIAKYRHYGFAPDGLVDHVMVNQKIRL
jgi:hypothetical protein